MQRIQIDPRDFSSHADQDFKYILHARDHFSEFSWAFHLKSKCTAEVATHLSQLLCMFGPARILQSDNGQEFTAKVITELQQIWPGLVIIYGRPRHPQSQGKLNNSLLQISDKF